MWPRLVWRLTPPEGEGEGSAGEAEGEQEGSKAGGGKDPWEVYRRRRGIRALSAAKAEVKVEPEDEDEDETPRKTRNGHKRALVVPPSGGNTPSASTSASISDRGTSMAKQGRKRRGEELLLLDDHLLPEELRRIGGLAGKRERVGQGKEAEEGEEEQIEVDGAGQQEQEGEAEEDEGDDNDDDQLPDITRCVCQKEGEFQRETLADLPEGDPLMIQCDKCNVWQHGPCMGVWADDEAPEGENGSIAKAGIRADKAQNTSARNVDLTYTAR